jgi:hypothetical protein
MTSDQKLLIECLRALNSAIGFRYPGEKGSTRSYALAAQIERQLRDSGVDPYAPRTGA